MKKVKYHKDFNTQISTWSQLQKEVRRYIATEISKNLPENYNAYTYLFEQHIHEYHRHIDNASPIGGFETILLLLDWYKSIQLKTTPL